MKKLIVIGVALFFIFNFSHAQLAKQTSYLGPSLGFYFYGSTPIFGLNYEYILESQIGDGLIGIGGLFRYWSWSEDVGNWLGETWGWKYTDIMFGVQANYHFKLSNNKIDPWLGLTLAYDAASVKYRGPAGFSYSSPTWGGMFFGANAGARYWFSEKLAGVVRFGVGSMSYSAFDIGVDFRL